MAGSGQSNSEFHALVLAGCHNTSCRSISRSISRHHLVNYPSTLAITTSPPAIAMFELPGAKRFVSHPPEQSTCHPPPFPSLSLLKLTIPGSRVRREDLYNDDSASETDSRDEAVENELRGKLNAQLSGLLGLELDLAAGPSNGEADDVQMTQPEDWNQAAATTIPAAVKTAAAGGEEDPEELAFEFRLFRDEAPTHTVVIRENDDQAGAAGKGAFVVPKRPTSYYIAGDPDQASLDRFRRAALSADYILADAKRRRWGLEKPWRITHITITTASRHHQGLDASASQVAAAPDGIAKRKRPGKKRRIILRVREKAKKEKEEAAKKTLVDKEEHLAAKKKRLNREKKLKRRAKEKEKKAAVAGGQGPEEGQTTADTAAEQNLSDDDSDS